MLRLILIVLSIIPFFVFSLLLFGLMWIVGRYSPQTADRVQLKVLQGFSRFLLFLAGVKLTVLGQDNIPKDTPVLYIINHRSFFDILLTYLGCPGPTGFIAKKEIAKVPVLGLWVKVLHGLFLDRNNIREGLKTILTAIEEVKSGISIAIFPEGTRGKEPDERQMLPFHEGSFKIAQKSGCPIVPVVISGSSAILEDHFPAVRPARVILEYLPGIDPKSLEGENRKFTGKYVQNLMRQTMEKNHAALLGPDPR